MTGFKHFNLAIFYSAQLPSHYIASSELSNCMLHLLTHLRSGLRHFSLLRHNPRCSTRLCTMYWLIGSRELPDLKTTVSQLLSVTMNGRNQTKCSSFSILTMSVVVRHTVLRSNISISQTLHVRCEHNHYDYDAIRCNKPCEQLQQNEKSNRFKSKYSYERFATKKTAHNSKISVTAIQQN